METRLFIVSKGVVQPSIERTNPTAPADVKQMFQDFGIEFPPGAAISFDPETGILFVTQSSEALNQIEQICFGSSTYPALSIIGLKVVVLSEAAAKEFSQQLCRTGISTILDHDAVQFLNALLKKGDAELLKAGSVFSMSGESFYFRSSDPMDKKTQMTVLFEGRYSYSFNRPLYLNYHIAIELTNPDEHPESSLMTVSQTGSLQLPSQKTAIIRSIRLSDKKTE